MKYTVKISVGYAENVVKTIEIEANNQSEALGIAEKFGRPYIEDGMEVFYAVTNTPIVVNTIILRDGHIERVAGVAKESHEYKIIKTVYSADRGKTWVDYAFMK